MTREGYKHLLTIQNLPIRRHLPAMLQQCRSGNLQQIR